MSSPGLPDISAIVNGLNDLEKTRLVSAVGLVILLYDHLLSLPDEVRFIWSASRTSSKFLFLGMRYMVPWVMIGHTNFPAWAACTSLTINPDYTLSASCKVWYTGGILIGWFTLGINDWLVLFTTVDFVGPQSYIHVLDAFVVPRLKYNGACIVNHHLRQPDSGYALRTIRPHLFSRLCISHSSPPLVAGSIISSCDGSVHGMEGLYVPRRVKDPPSRRLSIFFCFFLVNLVHTTSMWLLKVKAAINLMNAMIVLTARPSMIFLTVFFMWCFTTTATCRMILSLRRSASPESSISSDDPHEDTSSGYQSSSHLELAWLRQQSISTSRGPTPTPLRSTF
ncbi:hypothetical protein MVEN_00228100 [Mycena venus]|uniref:DUF6533 domain-containing protein n=1 Tax=Mycena venus TaxID=2733690 RepID=A0A8H7DEB5_9AGAR|nr:hypothetical protein MVEN_00228100 [Mycena venus]